MHNLFGIFEPEARWVWWIIGIILVLYKLGVIVIK